MNKLAKLSITTLTAGMLFTTTTSYIGFQLPHTTVYAAQNNILKGKTFNLKGVAYKITKIKVVPGTKDGKYTLVLETDITNHNKKPADLSAKYNPYEFVHAEQEKSNSIKQLNPGMSGTDENGDSYEEARSNVMTDEKVLPGKTVKGMIAFDLVNDKPVKIKFSDKDYKTIGTRIIKVKSLITKLSQPQQPSSNHSATPAQSQQQTQPNSSANSNSDSDKKGMGFDTDDDGKPDTWVDEQTLNDIMSSDSFKDYMNNSSNTQPDVSDSGDSSSY